MKLNRIEPSNLRTRAAHAIRLNIQTGQMQPGQLYSVGPVAEGLGVSPTPVREALFDLAGEGLVEIVKNRGFRVPVLSDHDLEEVFELRLYIEVPAMAALVGKLSETDILTARRQIDQIGTAARRGDVPKFMEADRVFHTDLLRLGGNRRLLDMVNRLRDATRVYGLLRMRGSPQLVDSANEHAYLLDAIIEGDRAKVKNLMTRHLNHIRGIWAGREEPEEPDLEVFAGSDGSQRSTPRKRAKRA